MTTSPPDADFIYRFIPAQGTGVASAPTLLLLHGTGGNENQFLPFGREMTGGGWNLLSPRGKVLEGGLTPRFFRRLAEGVFDEADVARRAHELADFVAGAASHYNFDGRKVYALGYSNGANIAAAILLLRPKVFAGAALLRPMVPLVPQLVPDLSNVPVMICAGRRDPIVPAENVARLVSLLQCGGAQVQESWYEGGHELADTDAQAILRWLSKLRP